MIKSKLKYVYVLVFLYWPAIAHAAVAERLDDAAKFFGSILNTFEISYRIIIIICLAWGISLVVRIDSTKKGPTKEKNFSNVNNVVITIRCLMEKHMEMIRKIVWFCVGVGIGFGFWFLAFIWLIVLFLYMADKKDSHREFWMSTLICLVGWIMGLFLITVS